MAKLTLSVDDHVISDAKRHAKRSGVSISRMVEDYLTLVTRPGSRETADAPILRSLRGILRKGGIDDYRKHLTTKYR